MASVATQLIEEVTAHAQSDGLEDARGICADDTYFPNNQLIFYLTVLWLLESCILFPQNSEDDHISGRNMSLVDK